MLNLQHSESKYIALCFGCGFCVSTMDILFKEIHAELSWESNEFLFLIESKNTISCPVLADQLINSCFKMQVTATDGLL